MASTCKDPSDTNDVLKGGLARDFTDSTLIVNNGHDMGVLQLPLTGALVVSSSQGHWVVGTGSVLWLEPRTAYKVRMQGKVRLRAIYLTLESPEDQIAERSCMLHVTPLMRELISEAARLCDRMNERRVHLLVAALLEELRCNNVGRPKLAAPRDPRLARVCTHIQQQLDDTKTLQEWAQELGCDARTLYRLFVQELGMPFLQWRQHVRLQTAMDWLRAGRSVVDVAFDLGYQNPSAFTSMFRRNLGIAPSAFVKSAGTHRWSG